MTLGLVERTYKSFLQLVCCGKLQNISNKKTPTVAISLSQKEALPSIRSKTELTFDLPEGQG